MSDLREAIESLQNVTATMSRDWSAQRGDAWVYGIVWGWDFEEEPDEESAMREVAELHGWSEEAVARLRRMHLAFEAVLAGGSQ